MASIGIGEYNGSDWRNDNQVAGCLTSPHVRSIRYSDTVLQEIRASTLASFVSIPRGGLEIGGVLFGTAEAGEISIRAYRALPIEYLTGPSFLLSPHDEVTLEGLIDESASDPELAGLHPVGWYHSHTRSEVFLSDEDIAVHERFFPGPSQVALVIKPHKLDPAQVGIFVRDAGLVMRGDVPYCRFTIPAPSSGAALDEIEYPVRELPRLEAVPAEASALIDPNPNRALVVPRRRAVLLTAAFLIAAAVMTFALTKPAPRSEPTPVQLHVSESGNQLNIAWNQKSSALAHAQSAEIAIIDGDRGAATIPLDHDSLDRGTIAYVRRSGDVQVRMRVQLQDGRRMEEIARFIGPEPAPATAPPDEAKRDEPDPELLRMKAELDRVNTELKRVRPENERSRSPLPVQPRALALPPARTSVNTSPSPVFSKPPEITPSSQLKSPALPLPTYAPPPPPVAVTTPPPTPVARLAKGRAIWTGHLAKGALLLIEGRRPSAGALTGPFPQRSARMRVYTADLADSGIVIYTNGSRPNAVEPPRPDNGWNLTTYAFDPKRSRGASVVEYPGPKNDWKRLLIRSEDRSITMLVIDWEDLP